MSMEAYVFINTKPEMLWKVAEEALKIEGVKTGHAVTGQYDVVLYAVFDDMNALGELIGRVHALQGVIKTQTAVVIPPRIY